MSDEDKKEKFEKPTYDSRLEYNRILGKYLNTIGSAVIDDDIVTWYRCIRSLVNRVSPFIDPEDRDRLKYKLKKINDLFTRLNNTNQKIFFKDIIRDKLDDIDADLNSSAKHMFLPVHKEEEQVFTEADFLQGSDL